MISVDNRNRLPRSVTLHRAEEHLVEAVTMPDLARRISIAYRRRGTQRRDFMDCWAEQRGSGERRHIGGQQLPGFERFHAQWATRKTILLSIRSKEARVALAGQPHRGQ